MRNRTIKMYLAEAVHTITLIRDIGLILIQPIICLATLCTQLSAYLPSIPIISYHSYYSISYICCRAETVSFIRYRVIFFLVFPPKKSYAFSPWSFSNPTTPLLQSKYIYTVTFRIFFPFSFNFLTVVSLGPRIPPLLGGAFLALSGFNSSFVAMI